MNYNVDEKGNITLFGVEYPADKCAKCTEDCPLAGKTENRGTARIAELPGITVIEIGFRPSIYSLLEGLVVKVNKEVEEVTSLYVANKIFADLVGDGNLTAVTEKDDFVYGFISIGEDKKQLEIRTYQNLLEGDIPLQVFGKTGEINLN